MPQRTFCLTLVQRYMLSLTPPGLERPLCCLCWTVWTAFFINKLRNSEVTVCSLVRVTLANEKEKIPVCLQNFTQKNALTNDCVDKRLFCMLN